MKINILIYKTENQIREDIRSFVSSYSNYKLSLAMVDSLEELENLYKKEQFEILILDVSFDKDNISKFLNEANIIFSKIIILSSNENHIFDFVKNSIFDFLVLPLKTTNLLACVNKCINKLVDENNFYQLRIAETKFQKFIPINSTKKIELIKLEDIIYFEADGRYTVIYLTNGVSKMASKNLGEFQKLLDPDIFCRIHHKFIINMNKLLNIVKGDGFYCEMVNNRTIPVSKRKLEDLNLVLNIGKHLT